MKFFHISDLHLGKRLNEMTLLEDQVAILNEILQKADELHPDGVVIAGDIYDKSVPPAEAVQVFDGFLTALAERSIAALVISGNHDSAERIGYGSRLMQTSGVYVSPVFDGSVTQAVLEDEFGRVRFHLLPFVKPAHVRRFFPDAEINDYTDAVRTVIDSMAVDTDERNVLVCHQNVTNTTSSHADEIAIGGLDNVNVDIFDGFDYVALGHIHTPAFIGREGVRFCGAPLEYSFNEVGREISLTVVEMGEKGDVRVSTLPLEPVRRLRKLRRSFAELTSVDFYKNEKRDDYLHIILTDEEDIEEAVSRLRDIYPNVMQLEYDNSRTRRIQSVASGVAQEDKTPLEQFEQFYERQNNLPLTDIQRDAVGRLIEEIWEGQI